MILREHQADMIDKIEADVTFGESKIMVDACPAYGKEQPYSEQVLTQNGWVTMGSLVKGQSVIGSDGLPKEITHIHEQGIKDVYELEFSDGTTVRAGYDHLWTMQRLRNKQLTTVTISTSDILAMSSDTLRRHSIKMGSKVQYAQPTEPKLSPYSIGILIGDGCFRNNQISLSNNNENIRKAVIDSLPEGDIVSRERISEDGLKHDIFFTNPTKKKNISNIAKIFKDYGLLNCLSINKFIPEELQKMSIENREDLLQGLLDSDGHLCNCKSKYYEYSTSSSRLAENIIELARGLGLYVTNSERIPIYTYNGEKKEVQLSYRIYINFDKSKKKILKSITKLDYQERSRCITINAKDSLYVTTGYTLTHNSLVMSEVARKYQNQGVAILINITALLDQISAHLTEQGVDHSILKADRESEFDSSKKVQLVMSQTLHARIKKDRIKFKHKFKVYQQDEGHRENATISTRTKDCLNFLNPDVEILYSGTPYDQNGFKFDEYEYLSNVHARELELKGFLCPIKYYVPKWSEQLDYSKVKKSGTDYVTSDLDKIINSNKHLTMALESMNQLNAREKKTMVFCSGIEQADAMAELLKANGYAAESYHSKTEHGEKKLKAFINNSTWDLSPKGHTTSLYGDEEYEQFRVTHLVSVNRLGIGFDCPDAVLGVQLRPTKIRSLYIQQAMRIARTHPDKQFAEYLDLGQTVSNFGFHTDIYVPPLKTHKSEEDKELLAIANCHALEDLSATLSDKLEETTRDIYNLKVREIKRNLERPLSELSIPELAAAFELSQNHKEIIEIACLIYTYKFGRPVSKKGFEYDYKPSNFWSASNFGNNPDFHVPHDMQYYYDLVPSKKRQWNKALKTRARKLIKEEKGLFRLTGFIKFMYEEHIKEENSFVNAYEDRKDHEVARFAENVPDFDVNDGDIPF